jgi:hypothetical protein
MTIITHPPTREYDEGWERIFKKGPDEDPAPDTQPDPARVQSEAEPRPSGPVEG